MALEDNVERQKKLPARTAENGTSRSVQTAPPKNRGAEFCVRSEAAGNGSAYADASVGDGELCEGLKLQSSDAGG
jgi:hypothetical protein